MKLNLKHYTLIIFSVATLIMACVGYYVLYRNIIIQAENSSKVSGDASVENEKKQDEQLLVKAHSETVTERAKLKSFFVYEDNIVEFIERVEKVGLESGTDLELSAIDTKEDHVTAHIVAKGSWSGVMKALVLVENLPYSLSINNVLLDVSMADKTREWSLVLDIKALSLK